MKCVICDRCKRVIGKDEKIGYISVNWRKEAGGDLMQPNPYEEYDFCETCIKLIVAVIDRIDARRPVIKMPAPEDVEKFKTVLTGLHLDILGPDPAEEEEEEEEEEAEEDAEEEPVGRLADTPKPSHGVNLRELRELVKAGKKPKEIAEHFGISLANYYNYKKKAEALWNAGML